MKRISCFLIALFIFISVLSPAFVSNAEYISGYTTKVDYENTDINKYTIDIDLTNQIITVTDNYENKIVKQALCTTGKAETPTGAGTFKLGYMKERFGYFVSFGQYAQYWSQIVRGIYIHSVMYDSQNTTSMSRSAYNTLGKPASHGCVRTTTDMAKFIFYNCPPETTCKIAKRVKNTALVNKLKKEMPSFSKYVQPIDNKAWPLELPAVVKYNNTPLRTGSSSVNDTTIGYLNANTKCTVIQISPTWCKLKTEKGKLGYVRTEYLLFDPNNYNTTTTVYKTTETTSVYARAKTTSKLKGTIPEGTVVKYVAPYNKEWCVVEYDYGTGYLAGHVQLKNFKRVAVTNYPKLDGYENDSTQKPVDDNILFIRSDIRANMRSKASTNSSVITVLNGNTPIRVISKSGNWYYCQANEFTGYIHKSCVA